MKEFIGYCWVDQKKKLISFHPIEEGKKFVEEADKFWRMVRYLVDIGYKVM